MDNIVLVIDNSGSMDTMVLNHNGLTRSKDVTFLAKYTGDEIRNFRK